ncbi:MAG TPA: PepSY domain-containing protein [Clostridia bacterium]|nr:PepSY domain-containing protein [Clostridia bacterium]
MKINNKAIERKLQNAIESSTPNILPKLLRTIESEKGGAEMTTVDILAAPNTFENRTRKIRKSNTYLKWAISIAAIFVIAFTAYSVNSYYTPQSIIAFDVNPSIELEVNRSETVINAIPLNREAEVVLGNMKLKRVDLDTAVNAIIGSMVKNGYINDIRNSILISVDSKDTDKGVQLQKRLSEDVNNLLSRYEVQGAVLAQILKEDNRIRELAKNYNITLGKATLIDLLVKENCLLKFEELAKLPINDINLLIAAQHTKIQDISTKGNASSKGYIGENKAESIARDYLGEDISDIRKTSVEMDYEDGRMIYEVELYTSDGEHEFEIDAATGEIIDYDYDRYNHGNNKERSTSVIPKNEDKVTGNQKLIGMDAAKNIALKHAGLAEFAIRSLEVELDREDGVIIYEVEFKYNGFEYEYEINAATGEIMDWEIEKD